MAEDSREGVTTCDVRHQDKNGEKKDQDGETDEMLSPDSDTKSGEASQSQAKAPASIKEPAMSGVGCREGVARGEAYSRLQRDGPAPHTSTKYTNSLKILIPLRLKPKKEEYCPLDHCGLLSFVWLSWMSPLFHKAYKRHLEYSDLWTMSDYDRGAYNGKRFERLWEEEVARMGEKDASLGRVAFLFIKTRMIIALLALVISTMATFITAAVLVEKLLRYIESDEPDVVYGIMLVIATFILNLIRISGEAFFWAFSCRTALRLRSGALALAFSRLARLRSLKEHSVGELVNVCANDSRRLFEGCIMGNFLTSSLVMLVAATIATQLIIGTGALIGTVCTFVLFFPIQMVLGHVVSALRIKCVTVADQRVQKTNEILTYIKLIKMYAWEKPFAKTIAGIRAVERRLLERAGLVQSYSISIIPAVPTLACVSSILIHVAMGNSLTASEAFTLVALLNVLRVTVGPTPFAVRMLGESSVALRRLKKIITLDRMDHNPRLQDSREHVVEIRNGTFAWDAVTGEKGKMQGRVGNKMAGSQTRKSKSNGHKYQGVNDQCNNDSKAGGLNGTGSAAPMIPSPSGPTLVTLPSGLTFDPTKVAPTLFNIDFQLKRSELTGVCGVVGSGKTSLITAILGEMHTVEGTCYVSGCFAYVPQEAWIFNGSVRENILFGQELDSEHYDLVLEACCLKPDLEILTSGDQTEIGERGINLSGGQKQRISLARAVYSNRDVYLLDDPLSAVDTRVGEHIFKHCIQGMLKEKTVMLVSHQLQYLQDCNSIVVIAEGRVVEQGSHGDLMDQDGEYARLINTHYTRRESGADTLVEEQASKQQLIRQMNKTKNVVNDKDTEKATNVDNDGRLTTAEDPGKADHMWRVYHGYVQAMGGYISLLVMLLSFLILACLLTFSNWWLCYWIQSSGHRGMNATFDESEEGTSLSTDPALNFYMMIYGLSLLLVFVLAVFKSLVYMKLTLKASSALLKRLFHTVLRSPMSFFDTTPTGRILNRFSKDVDELDVMLPVNADIALSNLVVIFASLISITVIFPYFLVVFVPIIVVFCFILVFHRRGVNELKQLENVSRSPWFSHIGSTAMGLSTIHAYDKTEQFITKFLELLDVNALPLMFFRMSTRWAGARMELLVVMVITVTNLLVVLKHGSVSPAMAGLAVSYAMQLTGLFQYTLCMIADAEAGFLSAQRILNYTKNLKSEAPDEIPDKKPNSGWPSQGVVQFHDYKMRYRDNLPMVLKGISCCIQAGERIGIVGRTGSGKSSLGVALFRLVEASEGSITIDGVNVAEMGLADLRSRISVIPQEPVLFIGTVRYNLDPFGDHDDGRLWSVLEKVYMKDKVSSLDHGLDAPVTEGGDNFSVGERQLLCMARALLRNSKILFLDEATAAIDTETDSLIQKTIRSAFSDCTTLTIAHRLNTVLDSDRILVMDDGKIVEFDSPSVLRSNPNSILSGMIKAADSQNTQLD